MGTVSWEWEKFLWELRNVDSPSLAVWMSTLHLLDISPMSWPCPGFMMPWWDYSSAVSAQIQASVLSLGLLSPQQSCSSTEKCLEEHSKRHGGGWVFIPCRSVHDRRKRISDTMEAPAGLEHGNVEMKASFYQCGVTAVCNSLVCAVI